MQPASVYQRLSNRRIDEHVRRTRSRTGLRLFDRSEGFKPVIDFLRADGGLGILSDQHAGDNGLWTLRSSASWHRRRLWLRFWQNAPARRYLPPRFTLKE